MAIGGGQRHVRFRALHARKRSFVQARLGVGCAPQIRYWTSGEVQKSGNWTIGRRTTAVLQHVRSFDSRSIRGRFHTLKRLILIAQTNSSLIDAWVNGRGIDVYSVKLF